MSPTWRLLGSKRRKQKVVFNDDDSSKQEPSVNTIIVNERLPTTLPSEATHAAAPVAPRHLKVKDNDMESINNQVLPPRALRRPPHRKRRRHGSWSLPSHVVSVAVALLAIFIPLLTNFVSAHEDLLMNTPYGMCVPGLVFRVAAESGEILTPGYPEEYPANQDCRWLIDVSESHPNGVAVLKFVDFRLETLCHSERVEIYDGASLNAPLIAKLCGTIDSMEEVARYSGDEKRSWFNKTMVKHGFVNDEGWSFFSSSPVLLVRLITDSTWSYRGFRALFFGEHPVPPAIADYKKPPIEATTQLPITVTDEYDYDYYDKNEKSTTPELPLDGAEYADYQGLKERPQQQKQRVKTPAATTATTKTKTTTTTTTTKPTTPMSTMKATTASTSTSSVPSSTTSTAKTSTEKLTTTTTAPFYETATDFYLDVTEATTSLYEYNADVIAVKKLDSDTQFPFSDYEATTIINYEYETEPNIVMRKGEYDYKDYYEIYDIESEASTTTAQMDLQTATSQEPGYDEYYYYDIEDKSTTPARSIENDMYKYDYGESYGLDIEQSRTTTASLDFLGTTMEYDDEYADEVLPFLNLPNTTPMYEYNYNAEAGTKLDSTRETEVREACYGPTERLSPNAYNLRSTAFQFMASPNISCSGFVDQVEFVSTQSSIDFVLLILRRYEAYDWLRSNQSYWLVDYRNITTANFAIKPYTWTSINIDDPIAVKEGDLVGFMYHSIYGSHDMVPLIPHMITNDDAYSGYAELWDWNSLADFILHPDKSGESPLRRPLFDLHEVSSLLRPFRMPALRIRVIPPSPKDEFQETDSNQPIMMMEAPSDMRVLCETMMLKNSNSSSCLSHRNRNRRLRRRIYLDPNAGQCSTTYDCLEEGVKGFQFFKTEQDCSDVCSHYDFEI